MYGFCFDEDDEANTFFAEVNSCTAIHGAKGMGIVVAIYPTFMPIF